MKNRILILGSSNVDLILRIPRFHHPGETIQGESLEPFLEGKGPIRPLHQNAWVDE